MSINAISHVLGNFSFDWPTRKLTDTEIQKMFNKRFLKTKALAG